ncbi:hypothetical protein [Streptomyces sp. 8L]|uniref:hypothetical protein n=1 Tax=Streptomyces sp. 8L TaxID=2877242 RepID=UPI001CD40360|nr:hypothetical protein [Streptomyces sp. 8L]MCA1219230.1 hypothetical protein [Streptomyces sp. 8L]
MKHDLLSRLTELDAAPRGELSAAELDRKERLLRTVLSDTRPPSRSVVAFFRRPLVRRAAYTMAGALAAGGVFLAVTADPSGQSGTAVRADPPGQSRPEALSAADIATWTATSKSNDPGPSFGWCLDQAGGQAFVTNWDRRGSTTSVIVTNHGRAKYCLAGSADGSGVAVAIRPPAAVPADGVTLDTRGSRGSGPARFDYAVGSMGSDVKAIVVRDHGRTVHATVEQIHSLPYGRWTAWWPDNDSHNQLTGTLTLTFTNGTTRTVSTDSLTK